MSAVILFSGGLDSTVMLAMALEQGKKCYAISFDYGQRHRVELNAAQEIAEYYAVYHRIISIDLSHFNRTSLITQKLAVPKDRTTQQIAEGGIPSTYVPARNTLFLAYALAQAEFLGANEIYFGCNLMDCVPYPDCRPEFIRSFQSVMNCATKQSIEGNAPRLITPLITWDKHRIVREGLALNAPLHLTFSCYDPSPIGKPCLRCDACVLRNSCL